MRRDNHQYKVGEKNIIKRKKNSKHELEFFLRLTNFCHQTCIGGYSGAYLRACYCDWFAIFCVVECVPSR